jgi:protein-L-isoaspartate(D-aspartate) O-methyltransferase
LTGFDFIGIKKRQNCGAVETYAEKPPPRRGTMVESIPLGRWRKGEEDAMGRECSLYGVRRVTIFAFAVSGVIWLTSPWFDHRAEAQSRKSLDDARARMVKQDLLGNGIKNKRVLEAMGKVPRHEFVAVNLRDQAYLDMALAIGDGQTISSPYIVAFMTEQLDPQPTDKVLEIGTGSGYQAAVLGTIVKDVYSIEIVEPLGRKAAATLRRLRYDNVKTKVGDGFAGWKEHAPFDKIIVTCSPETVPKPLVDQLREGGRIVVPVGQRYQQVLYLYRKKDGKLEPEPLQTTFFVPMTGAAESQRKIKPDPANPSIANGGFENVIEVPGEKPEDPPSETPAAWYYMQQMTLDPNSGGPGERSALFANTESGRMSHVMQGFAVDGRKVRELDVSCRVRGEGIRAGDNLDQMPHIVITFFDERRAPVGQAAVIGNWFGSFAWYEDKARVAVPGNAREASIRLGLLGGVGKIWFDEVSVRKAGPR